MTVALVVAGVASLEADEVQVAVAIEVPQLKRRQHGGGYLVHDLLRTEATVAQVWLVVPAPVARVQDARQALVTKVYPLIDDPIESARDVVCRLFWRFEGGGGIPFAIREY